MQKFYIGERPYKCDQCGVTYAHRNTFRKHIKSVHEGVRPHVCTICDKRFTMKAQLNDHLVIHTGEKAFVCDRCGKRFNRKNVLRMHKQRVHKQQTPSHACQICDKRFFNPSMLKKHLITHTGACSFILVQYIFFVNDVYSQ